MPEHVTAGPATSASSATVWATVRLPGFHYWPGATGRRAYLAQRHRHLFGIRAEVYVGHSDRDTEFHDLGDDVRAWWGRRPRELGPASCEQVAAQIAGWLAARGYTVASVSVDEDGENGATLTYTPGSPA